MELYADLAVVLLQKHPREAARALETLPPQEAADLLAGIDAEAAADVLSSMSPNPVTSVLEHLDPSVVASALSHLPTDRAARLVRRVPDKRRAPLLDALPLRIARALRTMLRYPEDTAGSLMDPDVLSLPVELTAREAVDRIRSSPENTHYNVYVLDSEHHLAGVVNLREILLASPKSSLESIMHRDVHRLPVRADRDRIITDPGWRAVHALPVVDEDGRYLGAIRYRTLRRVEQEILGVDSEQGATARALGDLFATGAVGMLEALIGGGRAPTGETDGA